MGTGIIGDISHSPTETGDVLSGIGGVTQSFAAPGSPLRARTLLEQLTPLLLGAAGVVLVVVVMRRLLR